MTSVWLEPAVRIFEAAARAKLAGPGEREAALRAPLEGLMAAAGEARGVSAVFHDEVSDTERRVRPDYGVSVAGAMTGYIEVKAPGHTIDPAKFRGHDAEQWERQKDLPNLLYTNGAHWRLYRGGELVGKPVEMSGDLCDPSAPLVVNESLETLLTNFIQWHPLPITSVSSLVRSVTPLTRLLRGEVLDQLAEERHAIATGTDAHTQPFTGLASDWRNLLFPEATDEVFADGYAQTVTFALLLARTEGIDLTGRSLHDVGTELGDQHSLMGRALQLLTDAVAKDFKVTLDLLVRIVATVNWERVRQGKRDTYLHLYEHFLAEYDHVLRQESGSYYTPRDVVDHMVRLTHEALTERLGKEAGFLDPAVRVVDPAMGTGTYLHTIIEHSINQIAEQDGPGAVPDGIAELAQRLYGFEIQTGPYAVAELRAADILASNGADGHTASPHLFVTNTLDDPGIKQPSLGSALEPIAASRRAANEVKANTDVTVVIGNPPYLERQQGRGGWVEMGTPTGGRGRNARSRPILDDFKEARNGQNEYVLKNSYVYFWRWATWKVFESTPADDAGLVCFITTSGYLRGPGFKGMRRYLREWASDGWIIDLTPEGQTPDVNTRIFPKVRQPLAIGMFLRLPKTDNSAPASISYRQVSGLRAEKFEQLSKATLSDDGWRTARAGWTSPLTPQAKGAWDTYPALSDLLPWVTPGVKPNRTWVYAPDKETLQRRWRQIIAEADATKKNVLFKDSDDSNINRAKTPLPRDDSHDANQVVNDATGPCQNPVRIGRRSLDRQWVIPDSRLLDRPRPPLWAANSPGQVFLVEQHSKIITDGPGIALSGFVPDMDCFKGSEGGRVLPFLHPDGSSNLAPGLLDSWSAAIGAKISAKDALAYIAAVTAHPAYTETFADELTTPGIRVPLSADAVLFRRAVAIGNNVIWSWTYGSAFSDGTRPAGNIRYAEGDSRRPQCLSNTGTALPDEATYDPETQVITLGPKTFGPVAPAAWAYSVGGMNVIRSWVKYRKVEPGGLKGSPLDDVHTDAWPREWTTEFNDLLTALDRITCLHPDQEGLLAAIMAGPLLSKEDLQARGTRWPMDKKDCAPRYPLTTDEGQLAF